MEGGFGLFGDPDDLQARLSELAESMQGAQKVAFADQAIQLAVTMTVQNTGGTDALVVAPSTLSIVGSPVVLLVGLVALVLRRPLAVSRRDLAVIGTELLKEVRNRLRFLENVGLSYLSLMRPGPTLSGGEAQRIRLASQLGAELSGVLYILDEPSIGLHQRDNQRLLDTLVRLRDLGNSVIVVEHDRETMEQADWVVDFGPGAGVHGGEIVFSGRPDALVKADGAQRAASRIVSRWARGMGAPSKARGDQRFRNRGSTGWPATRPVAAVAAGEDGIMAGSPLLHAHTPLFCAGYSDVN